MGISDPKWVVCGPGLHFVLELEADLVVGDDGVTWFCCSMHRGVPLP